MHKKANADDEGNGVGGSLGLMDNFMDNGGYDNPSLNSLGGANNYSGSGGDAAPVAPVVTSPTVPFNERPIGTSGLPSIGMMREDPQLAASSAFGSTLPDKKKGLGSIGN